MLVLLVSITCIGCDLFSESETTTYTVTFDSNGGTAVADQTVDEGETAAEPTAPTQDGFAFTGWYSDELLTTDFDFSTAITADTPLYAGWATAYTVSFNSNGGDAVADQNIAEGATAAEPTAPTRDGYTFNGWYSNETLTDPFDFGTAITSAIPLYASWIMNAEDTILITLTNKSDSTDVHSYTLTNGPSHKSGSGGWNLYGIKTDPATGGEEDVPMIAEDLGLSVMGEADNDSGFVASNEPVVLVYDSVENDTKINPEDGTYPNYQYFQGLIFDSGSSLAEDTAYVYEFNLEAYDEAATDRESDHDSFTGSSTIVFSSVGGEGDSITGIITGETEGSPTYEIVCDFNVLHAYEL